MLRLLCLFCCLSGVAYGQPGFDLAISGGGSRTALRIDRLMGG